MQVDLNEKVVVVTGSARRVGRGILLGFARAGAHVVVHHSGASDEQAREAVREARSLGARAIAVQADIRDPEQVAAAFDQILAEFGRVDVLVNSASSFEARPLLDITPEEWNAVMDSNVNGAFYCTRLAGRIMRDQGIAGCIINIADNAGLRPWLKRPHHSVSKAALIMLTQVTARSLAQYQIRANCLVLGPVLPTEGGTPDFWKTVEARLPLKRSGDPDDAARAAIFLARNDFITGAVLRVDGGEWLGDATHDYNA